MSEYHHKQAPIIKDGELVFEVDEKLQSTIQLLLDNWIATFNSCQDNIHGTCWIEFELGGWKYLVNTSFQSPEQLLYTYIEDQCEVKLDFCDSGHFESEDEDVWIEGDELYWSASVRFPKEDIPIFESLLKTTILLDRIDAND
jgi:hypothetical protein